MRLGVISCAFIAFGAFGAGCEPPPPDGDDTATLDPLPERPPPWVDPRGSLRLLQLAPDIAPSCGEAPSCVDVWVGDAPLPLISALPYAANTGPIPFPTADLALHLRAASGEDRLTTVVNGLHADEPRSLIVAGRRGAGTLEGILTSDDFAPPPNGKIRARLLHLVYGREAASIEVRQGANRVAPPLVYAEPSDPLLLDRGSHTWRLDADGDGVTELQLRWHTDAAGADDAWVDLVLVPSPTATPLMLVFPPGAGAPVVFPAG